MKYKEYIIKKVDTLQSISEGFGISIEELRYFHNQHCELYEVFGGEMLPRGLKKFIISSSLEELSPHEILEFKRKPFHFEKNTKYRISISNGLYTKENKISNNSSEIIWQISDYDLIKNTITLDVQNKELNCDGKMKKLVSVFSKFDKSFDSLVLLLNENKTIQKVINKEELSRKWEQIKFEEMKVHELEHSSFSQLIKEFDKEIGKIDQSISNNILYQLFFFPNIELNLSDSYRVATMERKTSSQLFQGDYIVYDLVYKSSKNEQKTEVSFISNLNKNWNNQSLNSRYEKDYATLFKMSSFDFKFKIEGRYTYNENAVLEKGVVYVREQASEQIYFIAEYKFELINHGL